jgi:hypothetical protein
LEIRVVVPESGRRVAGAEYWRSARACPEASLTRRIEPRLFRQRGCLAARTYT